MSENSQADAAAQPSRWRIENPIETLVGAGVLAAAAAFALFAASSSGATIGESYRINAVFDSATGVSVGTDVRIAGVKVGRVAAIELDTQTYRAKTVLALRDGVELPIDSLAKIDSEGLLGGSFIALEPGAEDAMLRDGEAVELTQGAINLADLITQFSGSGSE